MEDKSQKASELFATIGQKLRAAREAQGLSLGEVSSSTRINQQFLQAIEAGRRDQLPSNTFVRGFIRNHATALGLDPSEVLQDFKRCTELEEEAEQNLEPPQEVLPQPMLSIPLPRVLFIVVLVGLIAWAGYLLVQVSISPRSGERPAATAETDAQPAAGAGQQGEGEDSAADTPDVAARGGEAGTGGEAYPGGPPGRSPPAARPAGQPEAGENLPVQPPKELQLELRGLEPTWVRVSVDRAQPRDVFLQPAETVEWEANEEFRLTVGKSHGVSVYLNGEEILLPEEPDTLVPDIVLNKLTLLKLEN